MEAFNDAYVPDAARRAERYVSPLGTDLKGLPKTLLITSEYDILRDQGEELGRRMKAAGVDVRMAPLRRRAAYFHLDAGAGHLLRPGAEGKRRLYRKINGLR